jgi:hypothetical protein
VIRKVPLTSTRRSFSLTLITIRNPSLRQLFGAGTIAAKTYGLFAVVVFPDFPSGISQNRKYKPIGSRDQGLHHWANAYARTPVAASAILVLY